MMVGNDGVNRRTFVSTVGAGIIGLAGCIGGDEPQQIGDGGNNGDSSNLGMRTATSTTAAYAANQGIAAAVNENTDEVFVEAQTSPGTEANIGALDSRETEMVYIQNWTVADVIDRVKPFDRLDFTLNQVFHYYDLPWFFCSANEDLNSISDIDAETTVSPTPRGSGTAVALEQALDHAIEDYDRVSEDYGEQGSAMNEGRLDVGVGTYMNREIVPGWLQEMMGTADLRVLDVPEGIIEEWEADERLQVGSFPGGALADADTPDEVWCLTFAYNFVCRNDLDYDAVYEFLDVLHANREGLEEFHALLGRLEDEEFWVENTYDDVPFHPAAADFYEELGIWRDEFERGGE